MNNEDKMILSAAVIA